jgi:hypothetical protein
VTAEALETRAKRAEWVLRETGNFPVDVLTPHWEKRVNQ